MSNKHERKPKRNSFAKKWGGKPPRTAKERQAAMRLQDEINATDPKLRQYKD